LSDDERIKRIYGYTQDTKQNECFTELNNHVPIHSLFDSRVICFYKYKRDCYKQGNEYLTENICKTYSKNDTDRDNALWTLSYNLALTNNDIKTILRLNGINKGYPETFKMKNSNFKIACMYNSYDIVEFFLTQKDFVPISNPIFTNKIWMRLIENRCYKTILLLIKANILKRNDKILYEIFKKFHKYNKCKHTIINDIIITNKKKSVVIKRLFRQACLDNNSSAVNHLIEKFYPLRMFEVVRRIISSIIHKYLIEPTKYQSIIDCIKIRYMDKILLQKNWNPRDIIDLLKFSLQDTNFYSRVEKSLDEMCTELCEHNRFNELDLVLKTFKIKNVDMFIEKAFDYKSLECVNVLCRYKNLNFDQILKQDIIPYWLCMEISKSVINQWKTHMFDLIPDSDKEYITETNYDIILNVACNNNNVKLILYIQENLKLFNIQQIVTRQYLRTALQNNSCDVIDFILGIIHKKEYSINLKKLSKLEKLTDNMLPHKDISLLIDLYVMDMSPKMFKVVDKYHMCNYSLKTNGKNILESIAHRGIDKYVTSKNVVKFVKIAVKSRMFDAYDDILDFHIKYWTTLNIRTHINLCNHPDNDSDIELLKQFDCELLFEVIREYNDPHYLFNKQLIKYLNCDDSLMSHMCDKNYFWSLKVIFNNSPRHSNVCKYLLETAITAGAYECVLFLLTTNTGTWQDYLFTLSMRQHNIHNKKVKMELLTWCK
jgi:hypothetical protein